MCYMIENVNNYASMDQMMVTVEKNDNKDLDYVSWRMTSDNDYLGVISRLQGVQTRYVRKNIGRNPIVDCERNGERTKCIKN